MNADTDQGLLDSLSSKIIACSFQVGNALGCGFLEKVYENAMVVELRAVGLSFAQQPSYLVRYREEVVGAYVPDLVVCESVIVEIKALDTLDRIHHAQCMNYLRATGLRVALLVNFGAPRVQFKRFVWKF